jgi:hypothetical protein
LDLVSFLVTGEAKEEGMVVEDEVFEEVAMVDD